MQKPQTMERSGLPVFVTGCHRSGTNLLYDTLLSAGGFAIYRGYLPVYETLLPHFGRLDKLENRKRMIDAWLRSKGFRRSGLKAEDLRAELLAKGSNGGQFIRAIMETIARAQGAIRWAVYDPDCILRMPGIKADIPEALFIHVVRDGRDIALSLRKMGGFQPLPWDRGARSLLATALYWKWVVRKGRKHGAGFPKDYIEVHYEDLVSEPRPVLAALSEFLGQDLDYDRIQAAGLGRLSESNSSFRDEAPGAKDSPVNRWKERLSRQEIACLETSIGDCLEELGYPLTTAKAERNLTISERWMGSIYPNFLETKLWLKTHTPLGRLADLSVLELADEAPGPGSAPSSAAPDS
jgi:LPS sulfotransferase NodH